MSLLLALTGASTPDANGNMAFTTGGISFAGAGTETISGALNTTLGSITFAGGGLVTETGTLAFTTGGVTFAGAGLVTETGTLAFTTAGIQFAGSGLETETGTVAFTTGSILFAGAGNVGTSSVDGVLSCTTDPIGFAGSGTVISTQPIYQSTPGFKIYHPKREESHEEKRIRREAQGIVARVEMAQEPSEQLLDDAKDVIEQIKSEISFLMLKESQFAAENRYAEMIRVQLAQEQLQAQIEEIDTAFIIMMVVAESY